MPEPANSQLELTILMPCLNEAQTIATCVRKAREFLERTGIAGEVLIADNGSTDGSQAIAVAGGARVIAVPRRGYGSALLQGIEAAFGRFIVMGDADDSYDFTRLDDFVDSLRGGADLVMGNRFRGGISAGAMPLLHRYLGNPVLTGIGRLFFGGEVRDFHCGLRGFRRDAMRELGLHMEGMEFASEMVVKSLLRGYRIEEVPTTLAPDGRDRAPHLRTWRDGWRHLRFLLIYSPNWLFLYPGLLMLGVGSAVMAWLLPATRFVGRVALDIHTMLGASGLTLLGLQTVMFAIFTKRVATDMGLLPVSQRLDRLLESISLERGILAGALCAVFGITGGAAAFIHWEGSSFGPQQPEELMRLVIPSLTLVLAGAQLVVGSFFLSVLRLRRQVPVHRSPGD